MTEVVSLQLYKKSNFDHFRLKLFNGQFTIRTFLLVQKVILRPATAPEDEGGAGRPLLVVGPPHQLVLAGALVERVGRAFDRNRVHRRRQTLR